MVVLTLGVGLGASFLLVQDLHRKVGLADRVTTLERQHAELAQRCTEVCDDGVTRIIAAYRRDREGR